MNKEKFIKWYNQQLVVGTKNDAEYQGKYCDIIINVCDFSSIYTAELFSNLKILYFWFPLNEINGEIGVNSIYGALQILFEAFEANKSVYLHCYSGKNRSRVVEASFYYMMTGEHLKQISTDHYNRIFSNIQRGKLPPIDKFETFLKNCYKIFTEEYSETKFGPLDFCKQCL